MPKSAADVYDAFLQLIQDFHGLWETTPVTSRLLLALLMAGMGVYLGSRAERSAMSAALSAEIATSAGSAPVAVAKMGPEALPKIRFVAVPAVSG